MYLFDTALGLLELLDSLGWYRVFVVSSSSTIYNTMGQGLSDAFIANTKFSDSTLLWISEVASNATASEIQQIYAQIKSAARSK